MLQGKGNKNLFEIRRFSSYRDSSYRDSTVCILLTLNK